MRVECLGKQGRWKETSTDFTLTDINSRETNKGRIMLSAFEESDNGFNREVIELPEAEKWLATSDDGYSTSYQFRRKFSPNTDSQAMEIALTLHGNNQALVVTETVYIRGLLVTWVTWELDN